MTPGEVRARRVGLGLTQGDVARLMGVDDRQVRRWEAGHEPAPAEMRERYAALLERRDTIARAWVVSGGPIVIPADLDGLPTSLWWSAAGRALEVLDVPVTVEPPPVPLDERARRQTYLSDEQAATAREMRDGGATWRAIGDALDVDESTARRALGADGARTGPTGGLTTPKAPPSVEGGASLCVGSVG